MKESDKGGNMHKAPVFAGLLLVVAGCSGEPAADLRAMPGRDASAPAPDPAAEARARRHRAALAEAEAYRAKLHAESAAVAEEEALVEAISRQVERQAAEGPVATGAAVPPVTETLDTTGMTEEEALVAAIEAQVRQQRQQAPATARKR